MTSDACRRGRSRDLRIQSATCYSRGVTAQSQPGNAEIQINTLRALLTALRCWGNAVWSPSTSKHADAGQHNVKTVRLEKLILMRALMALFFRVSCPGEHRREARPHLPIGSGSKSFHRASLVMVWKLKMSLGKEQFLSITGCNVELNMQ